MILVEYDGIPHYRISSAQVLALLKLKIDNLTNPDTGIFGPFASESAGLGRPPSTEELENLGTESTRTSYPTITKGLLREGAGDGVVTSQTIQLGE